jgi:hypothetical protein
MREDKIGNLTHFEEGTVAFGLEEITLKVTRPLRWRGRSVIEQER